MTAANTRACFAEFVGRRLIGILHDALTGSLMRNDLGSVSMIFDDGRALTICSNGSYWISNAADVRRAIDHVADQLTATRHELEGVLRLAGNHDDLFAGPEPAPAAKAVNQ